MQHFFYARKKIFPTHHKLVSSTGDTMRTFNKSLQQNQQRMGFVFSVLQLGVAREIWRAGMGCQP